MDRAITKTWVQVPVLPLKQEGALGTLFHFFELISVKWRWYCLHLTGFLWKFTETPQIKHLVQCLEHITNHRYSCSRHNVLIMTQLHHPFLEGRPAAILPASPCLLEPSAGVTSVMRTSCASLNILCLLVSQYLHTHLSFLKWNIYSSFLPDSSCLALRFG